MSLNAEAPHKVQLPEAYGTPLPAKTPVNFKARKEALESSNKEAMRKLLIACFVSTFFIIVQVTGGILAGSIAIMTDSAHLTSDILGFAISILSLKCAAKPANKELSYGWHRSEIVGTIVSIIFIWGLTVWLVYEATLRIITPQPVIGGIMLIVAVLGLMFNIIQMKILDVEGHHGGSSHHSTPKVSHHHDHHHDHHHGDQEHAHELAEPLLPKEKKLVSPGAHHNINVTSAYLHVLGDLLMSIGVIIAAVVIYFRPAWTLADPICTYLFSVIICCTSIPVFKDCIIVLMEGTPADIDIEKLENDIIDMNDVEELHDLHLWSISSGKHAMSCHIISKHPLKTLHQVTDLMRRKYKLFHTTIQVENHSDNPHQFKCENDLH